MRNLFTLVLFVILQSSFFNLQSQAQAPKKMGYQGGARDAQGNLMVKKDITLRLNIINGLDINTPVYSELQTASTNAFGLFSLKIGEGQVINGSMDEIDWSNGDHFIAVEMDVENNGHFVAMGLSQLLSVPYAFYAEKSGTAKDLENMDNLRAIDFSGTFGQTIRHNGTDWVPTSNLYSTANNVGIGTTSPSAKLDINGNLNLSQGNEITFGNSRALALDTNRNIMQGYQTGSSLTTGVNNNIIGHQAGKATTTGSNNNIIGYQAGNKNTTGDANIFYGYKSGYNNTSGSNNYFIGLQAGYGSTTGMNNLAMGTKAGYSLGDGKDNTFVGREAGYNNTGNRNAFIGKDAGRNNTTGFDNTYIGYNANGIDTLENATAIGSRATVSTSNSVVLGNAANVGIGTSAPNDKLHVVGNIRMADGNQQAGYVPVSDANGTLVWTHPDSTQMRSVWELSNEVIRQDSDLLTPNAPDFVFGSTQLNDNGNSAHDTRMFFDKSKGAFRAGKTAGNQWNEGNLGSYSTAFGLNNKALGDNSFAIGEKSESTGALSFAAGKKAYARGELSVAMGSNVEATSSGSVAVGYRANASNIGSVALGYEISSPSPFEMTVGMFAEGYTPGDSIFPDPNNRLFTIGNGTFSTRSNALTILKSGNTGIGTSTPQEKLDVLGSIRMADGNEQAGYIPVSDTNGTMVWTSPSNIAIVPNHIADSDNDTRIQVEENTDEDMIRFDLGGTEYFSFKPGLIEVHNTTNNIALGEATMDNLLTGVENIAIGGSALGQDTSGSQNVVVGNGTAGTLKSGNGNVFLGHTSGLSTSNGNYNICIGWRSGYTAPFGSGNIFIGSGSGPINPAGDNKLFIDNQSTNLPLIYGEFDNDWLKINGHLTPTGGITDSDNDTKIQVEENADEDIIRIDIEGEETVVVDEASIEIKGGSPLIKFYEENNSTSRRAAITTTFRTGLSVPSWQAKDQKMQLKVSDNTDNGMTTVMTLNGEGNVGIGSDTPGNALDVVGSVNATGQFLQNGNPLVPVGTVIMYAGSVIPDGWMPCDGGTFNAATYPELNIVLGGNTRPDFVGRFPLGVGNNGTTDAVDHNLGTIGGQERIVLTEGQMPSHSHNVTINYREGTEQGSGNNYSDLGDVGTSKTYTTSSAGNNQSHQNMPPFYTLNFIIKAN